MFTVTRQSQWTTGLSIVEVSWGGIDYCNPDALSQKYPGEFKEFDDPREAVEIAIDICKAWRKDGEKCAKVGVGSTGGMTMPFEPSTFKDVKKWAEGVYKDLKKCPVCGKITEDLKEWYSATEQIDDDFYPIETDEKYCSELCADKNSIYEE